MELKELRRNWNAFGETDPLGAILTVPSKMGSRWDEGEFFQKGIDEIAEVMDYVATIRPELRRGEALDFGCGVGRLTQALALHFERCCGVDIAPSMNELANRYNKHGRRCRYFLNEVDDLRLFEDGRFDFIYSNIVLQHMNPEYATRYIREFIRILAPGGLIVFQLPSHPGDRDNTTSKPLPDSGFRARVVPLDLPATLRPGATATVRVLVQNEGDTIWPALWDHEGRYQVNLGYHWHDESGRVVAFENNRTSLAADLEPGGQAEISLAITAPQAPGRYVLEVEMVQEHVAWFQTKGAPPARVAVLVKHPLHSRLSQIYRKVAGPAHPEGGPAPATAGEARAQPIMEMYGIEQSQVEALIAESGARVLDVQITPCTDWIHARYCVTK